MNVIVTTHVQASEVPVHEIANASRWDVDVNGYLHVWSRNPEGIIATFAPGWISVCDSNYSEEGTP